MPKSPRVWTVFILASLLLAACGQPPPVSPGVEAKAPVAKQATSSPTSAWEQKWDSILAEAKKEGKVTLYSIWVPEARVTLTQAFSAKYGINLEFSLFGRGSDLLAKVQAEKRAGLSMVDVFGSGTTTLSVNLKPEGLLGPIERLLILPEVLDARAWRDGKIPYADKEGLALSMVGHVNRTMFYNTNLVREGEITSHKDLLKPQYKGKITLNDPTVTGSGNAMIAHLGQNLWGEAETTDFIRKLIREQELVILRDNRTHIESVARGKYAIGLAPNDIIDEFLAAGAPIKIALLKEDTRISTGTGGLGVPASFAHPNAATIFVNWLLSKEGQSIFARGVGSPSMRVDASTEGIAPHRLPVPGEKYYSESEDLIAARARWLELSRKIIEEAAK